MSLTVTPLLTVTLNSFTVTFKGCMRTITDDLNSTLFVIWVVLFALAIVEVSSAFFSTHRFASQ